MSMTTINLDIETLQLWFSEISLNPNRLSNICSLTTKIFASKLQAEHFQKLFLNQKILQIDRLPALSLKINPNMSDYMIALIVAEEIVKLLLKIK